MTERFSVRGFRFSGVSAGIKKGSGALDLALAVAEAPVSAAAVFTQNLVQAAPVRVARQRIAKGKAQVALVNSGNANACTGKPGLQATLATTQALARALDIDASLIIPASTGVIGKVLPADRIEAALPRLVSGLSETAKPFSRAILTTDNGPKIAQRVLRIGKAEVTLLGIAKGAGMIHPRMATTLGYVFTDARIASALLARSLRAATDQSFNIATVDGETSTNDMLMVMASGASDVPAIKAGSKEYRNFQAALDTILRELAEMIVADGEGAQHVAEIVVSGARSDADARKVAQRVATSLLVKTAMHGKDANWGRILSAAGMAGVKFDPDRTSIQIGGVAIVKNGTTLGDASEREASEIMAGPRYEIALKIGTGKGRASYLTCDVGHRYIDVNAGYRS